MGGHGVELETSGGYFGQVIVGIELTEDEDLSWIRDYITVGF